MSKEFGKGSRQKKKKCIKATAYPCKYACILKTKKCRNPLKGQAKTAVEWMANQERLLAETNKKRTKAGLSEARLENGYIVANKPSSRPIVAKPKADLPDPKKEASTVTGKGAKYLADPTTNDFARRHPGVIEIAKAIDSNNGIIDTGLRDDGRKGLTPGMAIKYGQLQVLKLNKPSNANPYGTATIIHPDGEKRTVNLIQLADGVKSELLKKQKEAIAGNKKTTKPVKLTSYLKEGGMTPISYDDWKDNIRAIKGANDNYTLQGYGATAHNINTWGSTEGNIKKAYFLNLVDNRTIDPIGDLPKLTEKTDHDRQVNEWAKSVAYAVESRREREKTEQAIASPNQNQNILKSSLADEIIKRAKRIDASDLKKGDVVKFARWTQMNYDDTMDLAVSTLRVVSSDGKHVRVRFASADPTSKNIFSVWNGTDGYFYPEGSDPSLSHYLEKAREGINKLPFLRTEYEGLKKQWQALNKGLPVYGSPSYASLRAKFDQVDSDLRSVSSEITKFESYSRKATQALQSHIDSLPKERLQKQEDSDKAIAALEDLAKLRVDDSQPTVIKKEPSPAQQLINLKTNGGKLPKGVRKRDGLLIVNNTKDFGLDGVEWEIENRHVPQWDSFYIQDLIKGKRNDPSAIINGDAKSGYYYLTRRSLPSSDQSLDFDHYNSIAKDHDQYEQKLESLDQEYREKYATRDKYDSIYRVSSVKRGDVVHGAFYTNNGYVYRQAKVTGVSQDGKKISYQALDGERKGSSDLSQLRSRDFDPVKSDKLSEIASKAYEKRQEFQQANKTDESNFAYFASLREAIGYPSSSSFVREPVNFALNALFKLKTGNMTEAADIIDNLLVDKAYTYSQQSDRDRQNKDGKWNDTNNRLRSISKTLREWASDPSKIPSRVLELYPENDKPTTLKKDKESIAKPETPKQTELTPEQKAVENKYDEMTGLNGKTFRSH